MRFIILHKTEARWEAGEVPDPGLIADVGALIGDLQQAGILRGADGLRASSLGARVRSAAGEVAVAPGPFAGRDKMPAGFDVVRAATLDDAVAWAREVGRALGDAELDVRPVTEPWDIGLGPKPASVTSRRFMVLRKATPESESEAGLAPGKRQALRKLRAAKAADLLASETMQPSARGRRCKNTVGGIAFTDGPFAESKELIAGFIIIEVGSLDEASRWAARYVASVHSDEADVLELAELTEASNARD
jgi:hypothetical protein